MIELLDIVDEHDNVVGQAERQAVYEKNLRHRIVHIFLFNSRGEMALQLRSKECSFCPGHWATAACGHVRTGESYEAAAKRELHEEIGVELPITFFVKDLYASKERPQLQKFLSSWKAQYDGMFTVNANDVERVEFFPMQTIQKMIANGEKFHPELLFLLKKHFHADSSHASYPLPAQT